MPEVEINLLAIILAAVVDMVIGSLWYSPLLLGKPWMKMTGISADDMKATPVIEYVASTFAAFIMAFVLYHFAQYTEVSSNVEALELALWVWLGFALAASIPMQVFESRKWGPFFIYQGYKLLATIAMAIIFVNLG